MDDFDMGLLDDKTYMVSVLRQKMLGIAPVFMYRIKDEKAAGEDYKYVALWWSLCRAHFFGAWRLTLRLFLQ